MAGKTSANGHDSSTLWLEARPSRPMGKELRLLLGEGCLMIPGAHDPLASLLARDQGFKALYLSGGALSASLGLPDLGVMTMEELVGRARAIVRASDLPLIVDGDTGYGEALNAMRLVSELEQAGVAAVQLEDQVLPKKCGHLNDKQLVSCADMEAKIAAASRARTHMLIIARTDAPASEGVEAAIERAHKYVAAGADIIFPDGLPATEDIRAFADALDVPVMGNMTEFGRTPQLSADDFAALGVQLAIWPVSALRVAAKAMTGFYATLMEEGRAEKRLGDMQTRGELYETIRYFDYEGLDQSIQTSVLPKEGV